MLRSLWVAKTGLESQQVQMDVITNNLANVSTNGFKRSRAVFEDLLYQTIRQPGGQTSQQTELPTGLQLGTGVRPVAAERLFTQGNLQQTSNSKDLAIDGLGFFQVQMPDGTLAYTRDGTFHINNQGQLVTSSGYPLLPTISIPEDTKVFTVGKDGTVSVIQASTSTPTVLGQLQLAMFMNPPGMDAKGENLLVETTASGAPTVAAPGSNGMGTISQGYVETSNVNIVEEMVGMIQTQRAYEINSKAVTASDQMLQRISQLG